MNWYGIVDGRGNAALAQDRLHAIAILELDDVDMVDVSFVVQTFRRRDADLGKLRVVRVGVAPSSIVPAIQMRQLCVENRGLKCVKAAVISLDDMLVLLGLTQIAQQAQTIRK